jgi:hypothetical protein
MLEGEGGQEIRDGEMAERAELSFKQVLRRGHITGTPSPLRCGRALYNISRIIKICGLPSIKYVFPKDLHVNMS